MKFASRMDRFNPSPSQIAAVRVRELEAKGRKIVSLTAGEPDFPTPDIAKQAAFDLIAKNIIRYSPISGTQALREAIQYKFQRDNGLQFSLDQITVGAGTKQVLFNAFMATVETGDEVILCAPYWTSYPDMVRLVGGTPIVVSSYQSEQFKIDPEALDAAITPKTKWFLFNSPNNPTGATYSRAQLQELADVLLRHPHVHVLTDDVYEHLVFDGEPFATLPQVEPQLLERTVICNGVSKAYSMTGWRLGFAAGPKAIIANISKIQSQSTAGVGAISQAAASAVLNGPLYEVVERTTNLQQRRDILFAQLTRCPDLSADRPEGAMYIFCSCAGVIGKRTPKSEVIQTDKDFTMYLLDSVGVAVVQGEAYGLSPYFRASFVTSEEDLWRGGELILEACAALR